MLKRRRHAVAFGFREPELFGLLAPCRCRLGHFANNFFRVFRIQLEIFVSLRQTCVSRFRSGFLLFQQAAYRCPADTKPPRDLRFADCCEKQVPD
jgi:hypothetical protein